VAVVGAGVMAVVGVYLLLAGAPEFSLIGWMLLVIGLVLLPVNIALRRRGVRAGMRHPFGRR
jgi:hypothetical protein